MGKWIFFDEKKNLWNDLIFSLNQNLAYNSEYWTKIKTKNGWQSSRLVHINKNNKIDAVFVFYSKKSFFFNYHWSPAGFSGLPFENLEVLILDLKLFFSNLSQLNYLRINNVDEFCSSKNYFFSKHLKRPIFSLSSGFSVKMSTDINSEELLKIMSRKRRYTLKQSLKNEINWEYGSSTQLVKKCNEVIEIYKNEKHINFNLPQKSDLDLILNDADKKNFIIVGTKNNIPVSMAIIIISNGEPLYLYAATTNKGRVLSASYSMIYSLINYLKENNYKNFDFLGISPFDKAIIGIDNFKLAFGGKIIKYNGEWEYGSKISRILGNLIVYFKK